MATHLKVLLQHRHWQTYETFCREYDRVALELGEDLVARPHPSRAQFHRWLAGQLKDRPHPQHLRVLEAMFPGWSAAQLFEDWLPEEPMPTGAVDVDQLLRSIRIGFDGEPTAPRTWRATAHAGARAGATLPPSLGERASGEDDAVAHEMSKGLVALQATKRLSDAEVQVIAGLSGNLVELSLDVEINIGPDGWATVVIWHEFLNLTRAAVSRVAREMWFENTREDRLPIKALDSGSDRVMIQRLHDADNFAKFACQIAPPIRPGRVARVGYSCDAVRFVEDHYWRQAFARYTRNYTLRITHQLGPLLQCSAVEELPDGTEQLVTDQIMWDQSDDGVTMSIARDFLQPGQALTLRWEVDHGPS
jgi:hypothetical protein